MKRRAFLRGFGGLICLPYLESLVSPFQQVFAATTNKNLAFLFFSNGVIENEWQIPTYEIPAFLDPILSPIKPDVSWLTGVEIGARGCSAHERDVASFLTGAYAKGKGESRNGQYEVAKSADWIAAEFFGETPLVLSAIGKRTAENDICDGQRYSADYMNFISWRTAEAPADKETDPRRVFDQIFPSNPNDPAAEKRRKENLSILDFTKEQRTALEKNLSKSDKDKLTEFYEGVRVLEVKLSEPGATTGGQCNVGAAPDHYLESDTRYRQQNQAMAELIVKAFQCGSKHVVSWMMEIGSTIPQSRVILPDRPPQDPHGNSHYLGSFNRQSNEVNQFYYREFQKLWVGAFAYIVKELKKPDAITGKNLLDDSLILIGNGMGDGNAHYGKLALLVAGKGGGMTPGRLINVPNGKLADVHRTLLTKMGVSGSAVTNFGGGGGVINL